MQIIRDAEALAAWRVATADKRRALVPTMGNLHAGHIALVKMAQQQADVVMTSIFVNPTQFAPNEDFASYPRTLDADLEKLEAAGCDAVILPTAEWIYPFPDAIGFTLPDYARILCGKTRPTHFQGVVAVITRLFLMVAPQVAVFGQKDYQQQWILRRMVADLHFPVAIVTAPIQRASDGVALSSRNRYLSEEERILARALPQALQRAAAAIEAGEEIASVLMRKTAVLAAQGIDVEYFECRAQETLAPLEVLDKTGVILLAARIGKTRLIDNCLVEGK